MDDSPDQLTHREQSHSSSVGPMAAIVIVVILLALGGLYFFVTQEMKLHQTPSSQQVNS